MFQTIAFSNKRIVKFTINIHYSNPVCCTSTLIWRCKVLLTINQTFRILWFRELWKYKKIKLIEYLNPSISSILYLTKRIKYLTLNINGWHDLKTFTWLCHRSLERDFVAITIFLTRLMTHKNWRKVRRENVYWTFIFCYLDLR